jgi:hypothetical protein
MTVPNTGCIATGKLATGYDIVVTGGNAGQAADGVDTFLVEVTNRKSADSIKTYVKKNMSQDDLTMFIENQYRRGNRKPRQHNYRR